MSCSPFDLRDYLLNELAEAERRQVDVHVRSCGGCQEEMDRLRITQSTLLELRDEEVPQRIGFVSDPVFEPSGPRRFWQMLWASGPKLGFASAAMLSAALVIFAFLRPVTAVPAVTATSLDTTKIEQMVSQRVAAEMKRVSVEIESRQEKTTAEVLAAAEQRYERQRESDMKNIAFAISILEKKNNVLEHASYESGGAR
jgi:anti-sigma factor RsiW